MKRILRKYQLASRSWHMMTPGGMVLIGIGMVLYGLFQPTFAFRHLELQSGLFEGLGRGRSPQQLIVYVGTAGAVIPFELDDWHGGTPELRALQRGARIEVWFRSEHSRSIVAQIKSEGADVVPIEYARNALRWEGLEFACVGAGLAAFGHLYVVYWWRGRHPEAGTAKVVRA